jgi:hypothetical protein
MGPALTFGKPEIPKIRHFAASDAKRAGTPYRLRACGGERGVMAMGSMAPHAQPSQVVAENGQVLIEGPDWIAISMTPDAAEETARRMLSAASQAREQKDQDRSGNA